MHHGSCLCGAIRFTVTGDLKPPVACHCTMCRKASGHFGAAAEVAASALTITGEHKLKWFQSSPKVRRGFCSDCGSPLFFDPLSHDWIAINMGAFDTSTGTRLAQHIFVANKGDYYEITDGLPQNQQ
ncbi:MAG: GFA family protein [Deltaproteobacteria bacterium]